MNKKPDHFNEWDVYKYRYKNTVSGARFHVIVYKGTIRPITEGATFMLEGVLQTPALIGEALGDPTMPDTSRFIDSVGDGRSPRCTSTSTVSLPKARRLR